MYEIESDHDVPRDYLTGDKRFPLDRLEIGQSFAVPIKQASALRQAAIQKKNATWNDAKRQFDWNYATRKRGDTVRLWRVEPVHIPLVLSPKEIWEKEQREKGILA